MMMFASFYVWFTRCVIGYDGGCRQLKMLLAPIPPLGPASHTSHLPAATHWAGLSLDADTTSILHDPGLSPLPLAILLIPQRQKLIFS